MGSALVPMDDALAQVAVDIGGSPSGGSQFHGNSHGGLPVGWCATSIAASKPG